MELVTTSVVVAIVSLYALVQVQLSVLIGASFMSGGCTQRAFLLGQNNKMSSIAQKAKDLNISEWELFALAFLDWFGKSCGDLSTDMFFENYERTGIIPHWVRAFCEEEDDAAC